MDNFDNEAGEREKYMNLMLVACVLSSYFQPASHFLASGLLHWFLSMREDLLESPIQASLSNQFCRILNNFRRTLDIEIKDSMGNSQSLSSIGEDLRAETFIESDKLLLGAEEVYHWVPTFVELEALLQGTPVSLQIAVPDISGE